ncbi:MULTISPECIES: hypothetical protein [unclassified Moorena]|uniref:hypothetical protein n=1 Tax=unclassified Moorena TaxID=2683338 RepID=UPI0013BDA303|nr:MULTISPECIES: hypothetical protein [unclassified Moorena]NEQ10567.1 hypothetical protein [Moorena sp. SIO4E2]NER91009.1 hypothetical protein [Moorena sp. SIO3A2]
MPVLQVIIISLARCQFHLYNHWQDASSTFIITGKMPVPQLIIFYWQDASSTISNISRGLMSVPQWICEDNLTKPKPADEAPITGKRLGGCLNPILMILTSKMLAVTYSVEM